jgi:hypothetical protein
VLSGPKTFLGGLWAVLTGRTEKIRGYVVDSRQALAALDAASPAAATWWRMNAPQHFRPGAGLVFHDTACTLVK